MIEHVMFVSRTQFERLVGDPTLAVISVTDPGQPDVVAPPGFLVSFPVKFTDTLRPSDAEVIVGFIRMIHRCPQFAGLLVQSPQGQGRAAALALFASLLCDAAIQGEKPTWLAAPSVLEQLCCAAGLPVPRLPSNPVRGTPAVGRGSKASVHCLPEPCAIGLNGSGARTSAVSV